MSGLTVHAPFAGSRSTLSSSGRPTGGWRSRGEGLATRPWRRRSGSKGTSSGLRRQPVGARGGSPRLGRGTIRGLRAGGAIWTLGRAGRDRRAGGSAGAGRWAQTRNRGGRTGIRKSGGASNATGEAASPDQTRWEKSVGKKGNHHWVGGRSGLTMLRCEEGRLAARRNHHHLCHHHGGAVVLLLVAVMRAAHNGGRYRGCRRVVGPRPPGSVKW